MSNNHVDKQQIVIEIAGIVFSILSSRPDDIVRLEEVYRTFQCRREVEVIIHVRYDDPPQMRLQNGNRVFDSEMLWSLYRIDRRHVFVLNSPLFEANSPWFAIFDTDFCRGEIYTRIAKSGEMPGNLFATPFAYPLPEVLMMCLLARGRGLMVHACGINDNGRGYLFAGNSAHGKTTLAHLWKDQAIVLNDDRIVLRWHENRFWMYGTPWHGDYSGVSPQGVPLDKIFFLRQARTNSVCCKKGVAASSMLFSRSFPTFWDAEGMSFTLDFCAKLVKTIPCYELDFVPNKNVVDFARCVK
jgi:hypothetical protein